MAKNITESTGNIFLDLGFPPHEAEVMLLRAQLAEALRQWIEREQLTQAMAAKRAGMGGMGPRPPMGGMGAKPFADGGHVKLDAGSCTGEGRLEKRDWYRKHGE